MICHGSLPKFVHRHPASASAESVSDTAETAVIMPVFPGCPRLVKHVSVKCSAPGLAIACEVLQDVQSMDEGGQAMA